MKNGAKVNFGLVTVACIGSYIGGRMCFVHKSSIIGEEHGIFSNSTDDLRPFTL